MKNYLLLTLLLFAGCKEDPLLFRTGADYFPTAIDNTWIYLKDNDTIVVKITDTTSIFARECWIVERNGIPEYWCKDNKRVDKLFCETIFVNGVEDTVAKFWIPWIHTPLLLNEEWDYEFTEQKIILGDTVRVWMQIKGEVNELKDNKYRVKIKLTRVRESQAFGSYTIIIKNDEWYEPNIGVVQRTTNNSTELLISYSLH